MSQTANRGTTAGAVSDVEVIHIVAWSANARTDKREALRSNFDRSGQFLCHFGLDLVEGRQDLQTGSFRAKNICSNKE